MKLFLKFFIAILLVGFVSCRDTKNADTEVDEVKETVEATTEDASDELKEASENLDKEVEDLDNALKELEDI